MNYYETLQKLRACGQEQLLKYYDELTPEEQTNLLSQIEKIDLTLPDLIRQKETPALNRGFIEPLGALTVKEIEEKRAHYETIGLEAMRQKKTAAVLLAGGQGTRLGFDKPKGLYNIGETHDLFIFECLINNMMDVVRRTGVFIPLYVMTSEINYHDTVEFFKEKNYLGYDPQEIRFFVQETAPCVGYDGKILLERKDRVAVSPNGNGGWFTSLKKAGYADEMMRNGIEYISAFGVDNVCQRINDPAYVGAFIESGCDCAGKVVRKNDPNERVGVLCLEDGKPSIVEYYEMTDDMIHLRDADGELAYAFGAILNYFFRLDRLNDLAGEKMPVHTVEKKIPCLDENGRLVKPDSPNGYKFELLILDMIHIMDSCLSYEVIREKEFAPIKNPTGVDSVVSAKELLRKNGVVL